MILYLNLNRESELAGGSGSLSGSLEFLHEFCLDLAGMCPWTTNWTKLVCLFPGHFPVHELHDQFRQHRVLWPPGTNRTCRSVIVNCCENVSVVPTCVWAPAYPLCLVMSPLRRRSTALRPSSVGDLQIVSWVIINVGCPKCITLSKHKLEAILLGNKHASCLLHLLDWFTEWVQSNM